VSKKATICVYCGESGKLTIDHVIPKSWYKRFKVPKRMLDTPGNRVMACFNCNQAKANKDPKEWLQEKPERLQHFQRHARYLSDFTKQLAGLLPSAAGHRYSRS
jgi:5-methylcytosine-specific restriction endonuclease McrA